MSVMLKLVVSFLFFVTLCSCAPLTRDRNNKPYKVICYWGSWGFYRSSYGQSTPENTNPMLCTHMMYGFAKLNENNSMGYMEHDLDLGDTNYNSGLPWGRGMYRRFNNLRNINPHLTTMISIGGWNEGSDKYSRMASTAQSRKVFVDSVLDFLRWSDFDGLDFDWEYPATSAVGGTDRLPGDLADYDNYITLLRELKAALSPKGYLLSGAVSAGKPTIDRGYNVKQVSELMDFINVMTYDFHGGWEQRTAHNAPLYPNPKDNELDQQFTTQYAIDYWIKQGADPKKLAMGIPIYGRTFTLANPSEHGLGAPATGSGGNAGEFTQTVGTLGYNEICVRLKTNQWTVYRDDIQKIPYAVSGNQWIGYDDEQSIKEKLAFLKSRNLGGAIVWSLETEDFTAQCGDRKFPLMKTISIDLNGVNGEPDPIIEIPPYNPNQPQPNPTNKPVDPNPPKPTAGPPPADGSFQCTGPGYFPDPKDETIFHQCVDAGNGSFTDYVTTCPSGTIYDDSITSCRAP